MVSSTVPAPLEWVEEFVNVALAHYGYGLEDVEDVKVRYKQGVEPHNWDDLTVWVLLKDGHYLRNEGGEPPEGKFIMTRGKTSSLGQYVMDLPS